MTRQGRLEPDRVVGEKGGEKRKMVEM